MWDVYLPVFYRVHIFNRGNYITIGSVCQIGSFSFRVFMVDFTITYTLQRRG